MSTLRQRQMPNKSTEANSSEATHRSQKIPCLERKSSNGKCNRRGNDSSKSGHGGGDGERCGGFGVQEALSDGGIRDPAVMNR